MWSGRGLQWHVRVYRGAFPFMPGFTFFVNYVICFGSVSVVWPLGLGRANYWPKPSRHLAAYSQPCGLAIFGARHTAGNDRKLRLGARALHSNGGLGVPGHPNVPHVGFVFSVCFF